MSLRMVNEESREVLSEHKSGQGSRVFSFAFFFFFLVVHWSGLGPGVAKWIF